jgi:hypothetical protein
LQSTFDISEYQLLIKYWPYFRIIPQISFCRKNVFCWNSAFYLIYGSKKSIDFIITEFSLRVRYKEGSSNTTINFGISSSCFLDLVFRYRVTSPKYKHTGFKFTCFWIQIKIDYFRLHNSVPWSIMNKTFDNVTISSNRQFGDYTVSDYDRKKNTSNGLKMNSTMFWDVMLCSLMFWKTAVFQS